MKTYFKLFACCIPVKGYKRSIICDTQRVNYDFIPNTLYDILKENIATLTMEEIKAKYNIENQAVIDEYFTFLENKEYGFYTREPENFPEISNHWEKPNFITNAILDFDEYSNHNVEKILEDLNRLLCIAIELRFYCRVNPEYIKSILRQTQGTTLRTVQIVMPYSDEIDNKVLVSLITEFPRISSFTLHSYKGESKFDNIYNVMVIYTKEEILSEKCCGQISPNYFVPTINMINEAQHYNTCLNKKVSIDKHGNIKNCPSSKNSFGNHFKNNIEELINLPAFQEVWNINKDQIEICKDCEFRYICQDCRAYTLDENNKYSKPLKCKYNPYEAIWS
jgi:SPASM domain peptide maturase of grasp-with-spasm system